MSPAPGSDVVVVGAGLAGLTAALRLADGGRGVAVLAKGAGAIQLAPATIDVLGYGPERVHGPAAAWPGFVAANPGHPYARLSLETMERAVAWFKARVQEPRYVGGLDRNFLLPTAVGVAKPTAVVPRSMAGGDLSARPQVAVVGWRALKDFQPFLAAANLRAGGWAARAVEVDAPSRGEADPGPLRLARWFDEPEYRAAVAERLRGRLDEGEVVAMPAVLGLRSPERAWEEMEARLERPVFEVPTLPPSVPGSRLFATLKDGLRRAGVRLILGAEVVGAEVEGPRVAALHAQVAGRRRAFPARAVVLATGGWASGGLDLDSHWTANEPVLGLAVTGIPEPGRPRFLPGYLDDHPLARAGIAVDDELRPVDPDGKPVYENVHAAGALLAGAVPWREKSGDGISLGSGYRAATAIVERWG